MAFNSQFAGTRHSLLLAHPGIPQFGHVERS